MTLATLRWKVHRLAGKLLRHARGWMLQMQADLENGAYCNPPESAAPRYEPGQRRRIKSGCGTTARW